MNLISDQNDLTYIAIVVGVVSVFLCVLVTITIKTLYTSKFVKRNKRRKDIPDNIKDGEGDHICTPLDTNIVVHKEEEMKEFKISSITTDGCSSLIIQNDHD